MSELSEESLGDPLASIASRIGARAIDWGLLLAFWLLLGGATSERLDDGSLGFPRWALLSWMVVVIVYETAFVALKGQTLGKMALGIELVTLKDGTRLSFPAALTRVAPVGLAMVLLAQFFPIAMVFVYFSAAFKDDTRGALDLLAGSVVIKQRR